jgi:hypothetical protein
MRKISNVRTRFAQVPNETIDDTDLDFMALALLVILLRQKDGWDITMKRIGRKYGYGEYPMSSAMGMLQAARYTAKLRVQKTSGEWTVVIVVSDFPMDDGEVSDHMDTVAEEPDVAEVRFIEPPGSAVKRFSERQARLGR